LDTWHLGSSSPIIIIIFITGLLLLLFLAGEGINASFDDKNIKRLQDIEKLDTTPKKALFCN